MYSINYPIRGWDAITSGSGADDGKQSIIVKRHPSDFRVFVKFTSAPVANAAIERSGESIGFDKQEGIIMGSQKREIVGAAISMSPVPKNIATFLLKYMAIHTRKGEPIIETLARSEKQLGTISQMSWQMAMKQLNLKRQIIRKGMKWNSYNLDYLSHKHMIPTNIPQYQTLAKMYNRLIDTHEKLESDCSLLFTHAFDPSCMEDSVHRITQLVSNWILDEIYVVGRILKESRHRLKL